jgi:DNA replication protein DnaC
MDGEKSNCKKCGEEFDTSELKMAGKTFFQRRFCDACSKKNDDDFAELMRMQEVAQREQRWKDICPPLYQKTNLDHPGLSQDAVEAIRDWRDEGNGVGLSIRGTSGRGKTRLAFVLGKRLHMAGMSVDAITATRLAQLCVDSYDDSDRVKNGAREKLRSIRSCRYLILDDLGKQKFTDRAETELYDLIETRTSHLRPTIWTANMSSDEFAQMMSEDRGVPIIRRLSEFSTVLSV